MKLTDIRSIGVELAKNLSASGNPVPEEHMPVLESNRPNVSNYTNNSGAGRQNNQTKASRRASYAGGASSSLSQDDQSNKSINSYRNNSSSNMRIKVEPLTSPFEPNLAPAPHSFDFQNVRSQQGLANSNQYQYNSMVNGGNGFSTPETTNGYGTYSNQVGIQEFNGAGETDGHQSGIFGDFSKNGGFFDINEHL